MDKVTKAQALYVPPEIVEAAGPDYTKKFGKGACCGKCCLFVEDEKKCVILTRFDNSVLPRGVCGYFAGGKPMEKAKEDGGHLTKAQAGYIESGLTSCGDCEYIGNSPGMKRGEHPCARVKGTIEEGGCCALFERD